MLETLAGLSQGRSKAYRCQLVPVRVGQHCQLGPGREAVPATALATPRLLTTSRDTLDGCEKTDGITSTTRHWPLSHMKLTHASPSQKGTGHALGSHSPY